MSETPGTTGNAKLEVLHSSPTVDDKTDLKWIVTRSPLGNYTVRRIKSGVESVEQTGIKTLSHAKQIVESKVQMWRAFEGKK